MSSIRVGNAVFHLEDVGEGEPLILLHGLLCSIESDWKRFIPAFSKEYRVIAVDMRGHGLTDNPDGKLSDELFRDDIIKLLDALNLENVLICGYSLGGFVGLMVGIKQPNRVKALVMHATKIFWDEVALQSMLVKLDPGKVMAENAKFVEMLHKCHG